MSKRHSAKYKLDRVMGENLWGRAKSPVNKRSYGPGQHGQRRKSKVSDFGLQLKAKQKLKGYYGNIGEKQFRKYYEEAVRRKGDTSSPAWSTRIFNPDRHVIVSGPASDTYGQALPPKLSRRLAIEEPVTESDAPPEATTTTEAEESDR